MVKKEKKTKNFVSVGEFLKDLGLGVEPNLDLIRLLSCQKKLTPEILEAKGWRWHDTSEPVGVYRIANNTLVDPKEARLWLKAQTPPPPPPQPIILDPDGGTRPEPINTPYGM